MRPFPSNQIAPPSAPNAAEPTRIAGAMKDNAAAPAARPVITRVAIPTSFQLTPVNSLNALADINKLPDNKPNVTVPNIALGLAKDCKPVDRPVSAAPTPLPIPAPIPPKAPPAALPAPPAALPAPPAALPAPPAALPAPPAALPEPRPEVPPPSPPSPPAGRAAAAAAFILLSFCKPHHKPSAATIPRVTYLNSASTLNKPPIAPVKKFTTGVNILITGSSNDIMDWPIS